MIITRIIPNAGMGNQMFMYAAGLAAASRLGTELRIEARNFDEATGRRPYILKYFPEITEPAASFSEELRICPSQAIAGLILGDGPIKKKGLFRRVIRKVFVVLSRHGVYKPSYVSYSPEFMNIKDNTFMLGYWESEKIFKNIDDIVRKKFTFPTSCFDPELSGKVKSCNSVALHVRRTDKVYNTSSHLGSDERYIRLAIEKISSFTENPLFFVFSDDIGWCKENLPRIYDGNYTFVEGQTPMQDMALMTLCRHVIMGPSTFSWWGAWLNQNPEKIIIAPDINLWFKPGRFNPDDRKYLLPERWIKIQ